MGNGLVQYKIHTLNKTYQAMQEKAMQRLISKHHHATADFLNASAVKHKLAMDLITMFHEFKKNYTKHNDLNSVMWYTSLRYSRCEILKPGQLEVMFVVAVVITPELKYVDYEME